MSTHDDDRSQSAIDASHQHNFAEANRAYFDARANIAGTDEAHHESPELARREVRAMVRAWPELFDEERTEALDYACGTGMVSQQLCAHVKSVVGIDISPASVEKYNARATDQGLDPEEMRAVCTELRGDPGDLDGAQFDIVVCCASYHHFPSIAATTRVLASLLKPGGALLIADIRAAPDGRELFAPQHRAIVPHTRGFKEVDVRAAFEGAGLVEFEMRDAFVAKMRSTGGETKWFIAKGVRPT